MTTTKTKTTTKTTTTTKAKGAASPRRPLYVHGVLDRSGSMASCVGDAVGGWNSYVNSLPPSARVSLTIFDTQGVDLIRDTVVPRAAAITADEFLPRGGTPLRDAVGRTVAAADKAAKALGAERVALMIVTDGEENSSHEFSAEQIRVLLKTKQDVDGWLVLYVGANQDAWTVGQSMGISGAHSMTYTTANIAQSMSGLARNTTLYSSASNVRAGQAAATFTPKQRDDAVKK